MISDPAGDMHAASDVNSGRGRCTFGVGRRGQAPLTFLLMIVFLLSAPDQTIIASAMPTLIRELNGPDLWAWAITSVLLTSTVMAPVFLGLGDL